MSEDATTLMARDETSGRMYPMFLERVFFVLAIVGFFRASANCNGNNRRSVMGFVSRRMVRSSYCSDVHE